MRLSAPSRSLLLAEARGVMRDPMLLWIVVLTPGFALALRFATPAIDQWLEARFEFDLTPYFPLIMSFVGLMAAGFVGAVVGFLALDQRDEGVLPALLVTPLTTAQYLRHRLALPIVAATVLTVFMFPLAGLTRLSVAQVVVSSICAAPVAAMYALFLSGFAENKVQGFALVKAVGVLVLPCIVAWFVPMPAQLLFGVVPHYWPLKVFWLFDEGSYSAWLFALIGLGYHALVIRLLAQRFERVMRR